VPSIRYPTVREVIETNKRVLETIRVYKADRPGILMGEVGVEKITRAIAEAKSTGGDPYDKAAALLIELTKGHAFESGNRRTAYAVAVDFLETNGLSIKRDYSTEAIKGIRSGMHKKAQVAAWLRGDGNQGSQGHDS
jgi:prophage maintenance system killer protein